MTPSPTASQGPSKEAMKLSREFLTSLSGGLTSRRYLWMCDGLAVEDLARAIDDAFRRGQVAEREECAKVADARADIARTCAATARKDGYEDEAKAHDDAWMEMNEVATAIRARRTP